MPESEVGLVSVRGEARMTVPNGLRGNSEQAQRIGRGLQCMMEA